MNPRRPDRRALLLFAAALPLASCSRSDPERELRATIATMAQAIERREPADFLAGVAEDFTRESSAFGKQDAKRILAGILLRNEKVTVTAPACGCAWSPPAAPGCCPSAARPGSSTRPGAASAAAGRSSTRNGARVCSAAVAASRCRADGGPRASGQAALQIAAGEPR